MKILAAALLVQLLAGQPLDPREIRFGCDAEKGICQLSKVDWDHMMARDLALTAELNKTRQQLVACRFRGA